MNTLTVQLISLLVLLLLSAYFSSAETALTTVNMVRIRTLAEEGDGRAKLVLAIGGQYQKMLSAVLIGNNIVNLSASSLTTVIVTDVWGSRLIGVGTGVLTFVVLIFGEVVPKTAAKVRAEALSLSYARGILLLMRLLTPLIFLTNAVAGLFLRLFRIDARDREVMTENDLRTYVDVSHEDGVIESDEKEMIYNVFDFGDAVAKDIMIPRIDMTCVAADATYAEVMRVFRQDMYTRIPVYEDNQDNVIGLINIKDLVFVSDSEHFQIRKYLRPAYYTYELKKISGLMMEMREKSFNVAFVLDEYGAAVGMITLEDLLEEIVGEIRDEYDSDEEELIKEIGERRYLIEGGVKLDDINDALHTQLDSADYDSIGGLMIEQLDRLPNHRETVTLPNGITLSARGIKNQRIVKVLMTLPEEDGVPAGQD